MTMNVLLERAIAESDFDDHGFNVRAVLDLRAETFSRQLMPGISFPFCSDENLRQYLTLASSGPVRIDRGSPRKAWAIIAGPGVYLAIRWYPIPLPVVAEMIRLQYLRRFWSGKELERLGCDEMGWDSDRADWYGLPA
jgi:hypothetical protein